MPTRPWAITFAGLTAVLAVISTFAPVQAQNRYTLPVDGEVVRGFEAPETAYGRGHRGVDLAAEPAGTVRAAADGTVQFAGPIAGATWVSIQHDDGIITSYGPLADLQVARGDQVQRRDGIGTLAAGGHGNLGQDQGLHFGARRNGVYIDPLDLVGGTARPSLRGPGQWAATDHAVTPYEPWDGGRFGGWSVSGSPTATRPGYAIAPNHHHLVLLNGLATDSTSQPVDPEHLGYEPIDVTLFSYAGRADSSGANDDPRRDQLPYGPQDTWDNIDVAAQRLAEQLREQAAREPGRPVDLVGHSLGGLVILTYLLNYHDPFDPSLPQVGNVVTLASPIHGSDIASVGQRLRDGPGSASTVWFLQEVLGLGADSLPLGAPVIDELAVGSATSWDLAVAFEQALGDGLAGPLGTGTRMLAVGGATDLVVNADRTRLPDTHQHEGVPADVGLPDPRQLPEGFGGRTDVDAFMFGDDGDDRPIADHRVLPGGHSSVLESEAVREVVWEFLHGAEVVESPGYGAKRVGSTIWDAVRAGVGLLTPFS